MPHQHGHHRLHRRQDPFGGFLSAARSFNPFGNNNNNKNTSPAPTPTARSTLGDQPGTIYETIVMTTTEGQGDGSGAQTTSQADGTADSASSTADSIDTDSAISTVVSAYDTSSSSLPPSFIPTSQSIPSTLAVATNTPTLADAAATTTPTSSATLNTSSGGSDPSVGAKAGIAIGVLAGILGVFLLAFFVFQKRRRQREERQVEDDEKTGNPFADSAAVGRADGGGRAPRLSLRPVTQFMPNLGRNPQHPDRRQSRGAMIAMVQNPQSPHPPASRPAWDRPSTSASNHQANPFGNHAETLHNPIAEEPPRSMTVSPVTPVEGPVGYASTANDAIHPPPSPLNNKPLPALSDAAGGAAAGDVAAGAAVAAVGAAGLTRKTSIRKDGPAALDLTLPPKLSTVPPSPAGTEFSFHSVSADHAPGQSSGAAAIAAAGGPPTSTVHRVQLDFRPTLEDEMELRAGQLVRLLHEYDDGWALCIRLDRSEQGVVPRTCLSTRPVKPRPPPNGGPRGPPVNPQRGGPNPSQGPQGPQGQRFPPGQRPYGGPPNGYPPNGPQGGYPHPESPMRQGPPQGPPAGGRMSPAPRAQSPGPRLQQGQGRPQSPAGMRSQSPSAAARRQSPPGPSQMNQQYRPGPGGPPAGPVGRKPVPGQAY